MGFEQFNARKIEVAAALELYRANHDYLFSALLVTDVVVQNSLLLVAGSPAFLKTICYPEREPGIFELNAVVSRKKQLLPFLTDCLALMS